MLNGIGDDNYMLTSHGCDFLHSKNFELAETPQKLMEKYIKSYLEKD